MKKYTLILLLICISVSVAAQSKQYIQYSQVDQNGNEKRYSKIRKITAEEEIALSKTIAEDIGNITRDGNPTYMPALVNYPEIKNFLYDITGRKYKNKTFLVHYIYMNETCSSNGNNWDKNTIRKRKGGIALQKKEIEKRNNQIVILNIFEEGISLTNSPNSGKEYFFTDKNNFLRNYIFKIPSFCGSVAVIKPNGEALVYNGEASTWFIEQHLKPETWSLFFPQQK